MLYNNGLIYPNVQQQQPMKVITADNYDAAKNIQMPEDSSLLVMDANEPYIYMFITDKIGRKESHILKFTEVFNPSANTTSVIEAQGDISEKVLEKLQQISDQLSKLNGGSHESANEQTQSSKQNWNNKQSK